MFQFIYRGGNTPFRDPLWDLFYIFMLRNKIFKFRLLFPYVLRIFIPAVKLTQETAKFSKSTMKT